VKAKVVRKKMWKW